MYGLNEFAEYLKEKDLVEERKIPFFLLWVGKYNQLGPDVNENEFSNLLDTEGKQGWQIRQALDALKIYRSWSCRETIGCT